VISEYHRPREQYVSHGMYYKMCGMYWQWDWWRRWCCCFNGVGMCSIYEKCESCL